MTSISSLFHSPTGLTFTNHHHLRPPPPSTKTLNPTPPLRRSRNPKIHHITATTSRDPAFPLFNHRRDGPPLRLLRNPHPSTTTIVAAGRSKKKSGGPSPGRIEGNAELRRKAKEAARKRNRRLAENLFYRHYSDDPKKKKNSSSNQADEFTEEELQMIGLGYDRMVRFMEKDDPNLRHPHDWYKYGRYGPYSWRGVVVGRPIRGRFSDERVTMISEVRDHEEWEEIERFEMAADFTRRLKSMDETLGFRYFWVFVRHPKWKSAELPWQQWTLVSEVVVEAGKKQRLDKWSLMGRLGNKARALITQCAAWMRPDIIYVRRPVYQCRFEPQDDFFKLLGPLVDPSTEKDYIFEVEDKEGRVETCTYFGGLCKIVRISPKAFVDDVVKAYEKLSDEGKSRCLEFLLTNHPMELLHPYTKEWKAKLEELELGCDAPDESDGEDDNVSEITDWIEDDGDDNGDDDDDGDYDEEGADEEEEDTVMDVGKEDGDDELLGSNDEITRPEESEEYWNEQWKKALKSSDDMEKLVQKSVEVSNKFYKKQMMEEQRNAQMKEEQRDALMSEMMEEDVDLKVAATTEEHIREEQESAGHRGPRRRIKKSRIPPELFLRAAVRPFTYRNLVKEIVLLRHAIIDQEVSTKG